MMGLKDSQTTKETTCMSMYITASFIKSIPIFTLAIDTEHGSFYLLLLTIYLTLYRLTLPHGKLTLFTFDLQISLPCIFFSGVDFAEIYFSAIKKMNKEISVY